MTKICEWCPSRLACQEHGCRNDAGDAATLRGFIKTYGMTPVMMASERDRWKRLATQPVTVTDAMCEAAINSDASDCIRGRTVAGRHVILDEWAERELWSAPVGGTAEYDACQRQIEIERMRMRLGAALAAALHQCSAVSEPEKSLADYQHGYADGVEWATMNHPRTRPQAASTEPYDPSEHCSLDACKREGCTRLADQCLSRHPTPPVCAEPQPARTEYWPAMWVTKQARNEPQSASEWCQPTDCGKPTPRKFMIYFDDPEHGIMVFDDEAEARATFEAKNTAWNCYLFGTLPRHCQAGSAPILKAADELHDLGFEGGWNAAIDECAKTVNRLAGNAGDFLSKGIRSLTRPLRAPQESGGTREQSHG